MVLHHEGFPIRKSAGHSLFPTHRGLSQVITSFIGSQCQGIHLTLFFAWTAVLLFSPFCLTEIWNKSSFYCLSFANNCILWVVRSKKTWSFVLTILFCPPQDFSRSRRNCSHFFCTEKPIRFITSFSQLQLSVSFLFFIRFSMSIYLFTLHYYLLPIFISVSE